MKDTMVRKVWITIISCLMTIACKCEERRCLVNETISIKYTIDPFDNDVRWKRDGIRLQDATMNANGTGCEPPIFGQAVGYEIGCRTVNNASEYTLMFKCRSDDDGIIYTLSKTPIERDFTYTPVTSSEGLTTCKNDTALSGECEVHCNTAQSMISWTYTGENKETISVYNSSSVSCNDAVTNLYKLTVDIDDLKDKVSGPANLMGILTIGGERFYLTIIINDSVTTVEPTTTQISSSRMSSEPQTSSLSSPSSSLSSSPSGQDGGDSPSTETSCDLFSSSTATNPTPSPLTTTELIVVVVCSCVGFLLFVVLVVCCVILSIRRKNRKRRPPRNKPYSDNSMTRYPYHHSSSSPKTQTTSSSNPGSRQPSSSARPELQYTNYGYNNRPDDRHTYRNSGYYNRPDGRHTYRNYDNRPSRRDDNRHHREDINLTPYRLYYQPHQYQYL